MQKKNVNRTTIGPIIRSLRAQGLNSSTRQTWQTCVTNSQVADRESWLVEYSILALGFSQSNPLDQMYAKEVYFCNIVTKSNNPVQHAPNIHPNVFKYFLRTLRNPSPSSDISLHFTAEPLPFVTYPFFLTRTLKTIEKQVHILPVREMILDCQI